MKLLIVSHTPHYRHEGRYLGWGPTVRELGYLAELFDEVIHIAPVYEEAPPASALPYASDRIRLNPVAPAGGVRLSDKLNILQLYPGYVATIREEMAKVDAIHVRCPANISLLALLMLRFSGQPVYRWVKYAGNWRPEGREAWSYTIQRRWLSANRHNGVVTVNGRWPGQPAHIHSFLNPSLTDQELVAGEAAFAAKQLSLPVELLFLGALNDAKGVGRVLDIAGELQDMQLPFRLHVVGDGPDRPRYEKTVLSHGLREVYFHGWVPREQVPAFTAAAHFILLPSLSSEGWPKVLSEAMAFGAVPITSTISSMPQILGETGAGLTFQAGDIKGMAGAIAGYVNDPATWQAAGEAGVAAARRFSYRAYQAAVVRLFQETWGVSLRPPSQEIKASSERSANQTPAGIKLALTSNGHDRN